MSVQRPPARDESVNPARPEMIYGPTQEPTPPAADPNPPRAEAQGPQAPKADRNNLAIAGAGGILAILAFVAGAAVGHAWEPTPATQTGGPGGGPGIQIGPNGAQPNNQQNGGQP